MDEFKCEHCGGTTYYTKEVGPHLGVYCSTCNRWAKWIKKSSSRYEPKSPITVKVVKSEAVVQDTQLDDDKLPWD